MKYTPGLTDRQIQENNDIFNQRQDLYRAKGLDFLKFRRFILDKSGTLTGNILDVGSGRGVMALALARAGYRVVSIDKNEEMLLTTALNLAYENLLPLAELHVMDAYSLEFADGGFDNIFIVEALHHIEDIDGFFSEIDRVLSSGGKLVVADFNKKGMEIVDLVHGNEGNKHENSFVGQEEAKIWVDRNGYRVRSYEDECHWVLIADKK
ncbi:MAG: methyltransferase domain-containing protein [Candidatus Omnitrophota bacterium]